MTTNQRFSFNEDRYIIDRLNPAVKYLVRYCWEVRRKMTCIYANKRFGAVLMIWLAI